MSHFKAIAISISLLVLLYILDAIFPDYHGLKNYFLFTYGFILMVVSLITGLILIIFYLIFQKINQALIAAVAANTLVYAITIGLTSFALPAYDFKAVWLFIPPAVFYFLTWYTKKEK